MNRLERQAADGKTGKTAGQRIRLDLVVLDELGYLPFAGNGGRLLSHLISRLYEVADQGMTAVIPPNRSRSKAIPYDTEIYKESHLVECFINKVKHFRRIATRYDKTAASFLSMLCLCAAMIWLR